VDGHELSLVGAQRASLVVAFHRRLAISPRRVKPLVIHSEPRQEHPFPLATEANVTQRYASGHSDPDSPRAFPPR